MGKFFTDLVRILVSGAEDKGAQIPDANVSTFATTAGPGSVLISCEGKDYEALAAAALCVSKLEEHILRQCNEGLRIIANFEPMPFFESARQIVRARACLVFLSRNTMYDPEQLIAMVELGAQAME